MMNFANWVFILVSVYPFSNSIADDPKKDCDRLAQINSLTCKRWSTMECREVFYSDCDDINQKSTKVLCSSLGLNVVDSKDKAKLVAKEDCLRIKNSDPDFKRKECEEIRSNYQKSREGITNQVGSSEDWFILWHQRCKEFGDILSNNEPSENSPQNSNSPVCTVLDQLAVEGGTNITKLNSFKDNLVKYCPDRIKVNTIIK